jgi:hypothetical protein
MYRHLAAAVPTARDHAVSAVIDEWFRRVVFDAAATFQERA